MKKYLRIEIRRKSSIKGKKVAQGNLFIIAI